jgi:hypothetical protein
VNAVRFDVRLSLVVVLLGGMTACGSADASPEDRTAQAIPTVVTTTVAPAPSSTSVAIVPPTPVINPVRSWRTLVATSLSDAIHLPDPVEGPSGTWIAASASGETARIWSLDEFGSWGVAATVQLDDQSVLPGEPVPGGGSEETIAVDGAGADVRFLIPTAYANGPAVAAIGHDGSAWRLLQFTGFYGDALYAMDAEIDGASIVVSANDCQPSCADGTVTPVTAVRTTSGYDIPEPPARPAPARAPAAPGPGDRCEPFSSPDCVDQWGDGDWRYIVGIAECVNTFGFDGESFGVCADLDHDGFAGYPDTH